jgi:hypothetical protein
MYGYIIATRTFRRANFFSTPEKEERGGGGGGWEGVNVIIEDQMADVDSALIIFF